ncbi:unnamed protein product [Fraxinus pennsylvanica]|uniref:Ubiquitin carboxyl-terminal hydrolase n=1 Tax=Fraxinus pennsylvanica TaxID=56036 RepID=A0AAD2DJ12_9LAMI|nr:unnamed protein product [Fraxinus pennsylvanica]
MENNSFEISPPNSLDSSKTLDGQTLASCSKLENSSTWGIEALQDDSDVRDAVFYTDEENEEKGCEIRDDGPSNLSPIAGPCSKNIDFDGEPLALNAKPSASDWGERHPQKTPVEIEPDPPVLTMLLEDVKPVILGGGLENLGNTCFMNAVLQCFIHTVPLLQGLFNSSHSTACHFNSEGFCVLCDLRELVELALISATGVVSPWKLVNNLSYFSSSFRRFQQEDAHEFLQCFLDRLESSENLKPNEAVSSRNDNFVKRVFGGRLVSKLKCCNCGHSSDTYEPSIDLSLEIGDADTLLIALQSFTKVEKIEDPETKFTCEECKEQVSVEKQLVLDHAPSIAAFHLKRFKSDGRYVEKIDKHVAFPLELDLLPFTCGDKTNAELKYELYAVVVHVGFTSTSGHFYCFIRVLPDMWCKFDDSKVIWVHEQFVLSQEAYILFYAKQGTAWFSNLIESQKRGSDSTILNTSPKSVLDNADIHASPLVQNNNGSDVHGSNDISDESLTEDCSEQKHSGVENMEIKDNRSKTIRDLPKESTSLPTVANNSSDVLSHEAHKVISSSSLQKVIIDVEVGAVGNNPNITPQTPQRCSSPEIHGEEQPDAGFSILRDHLRLVDGISCKRKLEKDLETNQACSFIRKSIPGARGQQLMATLNLRGSRSEGAVNKKRKRILSPNRGKSATTTHHRSIIAAKMRRLIGVAFRLR